MNGNGGTGGWGYLRDGFANAGKRAFFFAGQSASHTTTANSTSNPEVISGTFAGGAGGAFQMYVNGVLQTLDINTGQISVPVENFRLGADDSTGNQRWKGFISELIIFDGAMKNADRIEIERYLGKKYGIKVQ
jgi:hypothetical protein